MNYDAGLLLQAFIVGLATWRISSFFVAEEGPFNVFVNMRNRCGIVVTDDGLQMAPETQMAKLLSCVWCFSTWAAPVMWLLYLYIPELVFIIASMTVVIAAERWIAPK